MVRYPDGTEEEIPTGAVLLATNGFGANRELVARHLPEIADALYQGSDQSLGDALRIGTELGAATAFSRRLSGARGRLDPRRARSWVGRRSCTAVCSSTAPAAASATRRPGYSEYAAELAARPGATGWIVLDEVVHEQCLPFQDYRDTVASGALVWAEDAQGLAAAIDVRRRGPGRRTASIRGGGAQVNVPTSSAGPTGNDRCDRRTRRCGWCPPSSTPKAGLLVNEHAAVVTPKTQPIPGLYAAGGAAAGISGHGAAGYLPGNGLLPAFGLAYLAADHVASKVRTRE